MEIKMGGRILKFNSDKADELIARYKEQIEEINHNIENIVDYTISWYVMLKDKYGKNYPPAKQRYAASILLKRLK